MMEDPIVNSTPFNSETVEEVQIINLSDNTDDTATTDLNGDNEDSCTNNISQANVEDISEEHIDNISTTNESENKNDDSNEELSSDSMPDLIYPEKKSKTPTDLKSTLSSSTSQDTGFSSDGVGDTSPDDTFSKTDFLTTSSSDTLDGETKEQLGAERQEEENVMDILGNGLLIKKILVPGKGIDTRPTNGDIVTLKVEGKLEDGKLVENEVITFHLNDGDVILALDLATALMENGEKCELTTDAKYAYGSLGRDPDIPKDSKLIYTLELLSYQSAPELSSLTFEERLQLGEAKRERGNYLFGRTDYTGAINSYNKAVKVLVDAELNAGLDKTSHALLLDSSVKCYNNMAACQLKIDAFDAAIRSCEKVLASQNNNVKALYRIGKAYGAKGDIDKAIEYMRQAIKLDPESKMLNQEMLYLTRRKSKETATEKELYQKMLGVKPNENQSYNQKKKTNSNSFLKWTLTAGVVAAAFASIGLALYRSS